MTGNMAARGEGLAGLVAALEAARKFIRGKHSTIPFGPQALIDQIDAALEAAAPPSTPTKEFIRRADERPPKYIAKGHCIFLTEKDWPPVLRDNGASEEVIAHIAHALNLFAALATPSPQAPLGPNCNKLRHGMGYSYCPGCPPEDSVSPAATQEQPAGSGAQLLTAEDVESTILFSYGTFIDYKIAAASLNRKVRERLAGSPRKVGEDGPEQLMTATGPVSLADFSRNLADDIYAISDGAAPDRETLRAMIRARLEVGLKYWKWERAVLVPRSSSVPVGEQKQEEGV